MSKLPVPQTLEEELDPNRNNALQLVGAYFHDLIINRGYAEGKVILSSDEVLNARRALDEFSFTNMEMESAILYAAAGLASLGHRVVMQPDAMERLFRDLKNEMLAKEQR